MSFKQRNPTSVQRNEPAGRAGIALVATCVAWMVLGPAAVRAEEIRIGLVKSASTSTIYIAQERGYFAAEGLTPKLVTFSAAEPIAVAAVSGDLDVASTGTSAGLFNLAGQGALKIIAAAGHEAPGFQQFTFVVSNAAYAAGLKSFQDLRGHSVAITQIGGPGHYSLALLEEKFGIDPKSIRLLALQSNGNIVSAVTGAQADSGTTVAAILMPAITRGDIKLLGFVGDEVPWQNGVIFAPTKITNERRDMLTRFLRALNRARQDYYAAFTDADGKRRDGPTAQTVLGLMADYLGQSADQVRQSIAYMDPDGRLDIKDIAHQIVWYRSQGMLKGEFDAETIIDRRHVVALAGP